MPRKPATKPRKRAPVSRKAPARKPAARRPSRPNGAKPASVAWLEANVDGYVADYFADGGTAASYPRDADPLPDEDKARLALSLELLKPADVRGVFYDAGDGRDARIAERDGDILALAVQDGRAEDAEVYGAYGRGGRRIPPDADVVAAVLTEGRQRAARVRAAIREVDARIASALVDAQNYYRR